jgi:hypothetical protein
MTIRARVVVGAVLVALAPRAAASTPLREERIAVIVGANLGRDDESPLRFAERDARRFHELLLELGNLSSERAIMILGSGPEPVLQALIEARGRAAEIQASGKRVALFFYYSGHGDEHQLHLSGGDLSLERLHRALDAIPADLRITFLDACQTEGRTKGLKRGPPFELGLRRDTPEGSVELRAASTGEAAQESDELGGAVFTHYLISGLRGGADLDGDGRVTLEELYAYAYRRTLRRTGSGPALQHAAMHVDLSGAGELVLTYPTRATSVLEVPEGDRSYLVFEQPSDAMLGEVSSGDSRRLALPAGRYLVAERGQGRVGVTYVDLSWGGHRALRSEDFEPIGREEWVTRGGHIELWPWQAELNLGLELPLGVADGPALRTGARVVAHRGILELSIDAAFVDGRVSTPGFDGVLRAVTGGPRVGGRIFLGPFAIIGTLGAELRYAFERLERLDAARAASAGFSTIEHHDFGALGPHVGLAVRLAITEQVTAAIETSADVLFRKSIDGLGGLHWAIEPVTSFVGGVGYAF